MTNLISGKEALIALANGEDVEVQALGDMNWYDSTQWTVGELLCFKGRFRIKPRTIKLSLEIPAPFEPNHGDEIWFLNPDYGCGYADGDYDPAESVIQFGVWRTEDEVKQVVAALRQIFGLSDDAVNAVRGWK